MSIFSPNADTSQGGIVSSLYSYDLVSFSNPELATATIRALDRSRIEFTHLDYNSEQRAKSIKFIAVLATMQFNRTGKLEDVNESIQALVELCNSDAAVQPDCHRATAQTFLKRFDITRNIEDLNKACDYFERESQLYPDAALERVGALSSLGTVLTTRFSLLGRREDLKRAIKSHKEALMIRRTDPGAGASLAFQLEELANDLVKEFEEYGEPSRPEAILTAINYLSEALEFRLPGHPLRNQSLTCICRALTVYVHRQVGNTKAIENYLHWAAELISEALDGDGQSSDQEPVERIAVLAFTARVIAERGGFKSTPLVVRIVEYLSQAISDVDNDDHPCFVGIYQNTAVLYLKSFFEFDKAFQHFKKAAKYGLGILRERLSAAVEWAAEARRHQHNTTEDAYKTAMDLLDRCQIMYMTVDSKHEFLVHHLIAKEASSLPSDAASFAIEKGHLKEAVEILERGRTFVWYTMHGYRPELGKLRSVSPDLADKFESLSTKLERFAVLSKLPSSHPTHHALLAPLDDRAVRDGSVLRDEWEATVKDIRNVLGFRGFLKPQSFDGLHGLHQAAAKGPVIMLNLSNNYRADALILLHSAPIILVPLGKPEDIVELIQCYAKSGPQLYHPESRKLKSQFLFVDDTHWTHSTLSFFLKRCSGLIMNHVKAALLNAGVASKSRIWLCPTGLITTLPLHAAGGPVFDHLSAADPFFIPSYTISLSALITARLNTRVLYPDAELLIVGAPEIQGLPFLPGVEEECRIVRELVPNGRDLLGTLASREEVLKCLPSHSWVHFACHGRHDDNSPFESAFMIYDGPFTLREIMTIRLASGCAGLAFLSACHTAAPSLLAPNEVLHLSAGIQFCGFASVVGTQWSVADKTAADLAKVFYKELFRGENKAHLTYSAEALHTSLMLLKECGTRVEHLVPFIHVGI